MNIRPLTYLPEQNCDEHIILSHLMYDQNINRRNIVNDNGNVINLDKTLIKKRELKINNVVLIQDDKITPRSNWKRGKVEELIVSRDCGAVLRVYNKQEDSTFLLKRPMPKVIPFETMNCVKEDNKNVPYVIGNRPQQQAVVTGQLMCRMKNS